MQTPSITSMHIDPVELINFAIGVFPCHSIKIHKNTETLCQVEKLSCVECRYIYPPTTIHGRVGSTTMHA